MKTLHALAIGTALLVAFGCQQEQKETTLEASRWEPIEFSFAHAHGDHPYWTHGITGKFLLSGSTDTIRVQAFWASADSVKLRFTPLDTGNYSYWINGNNETVEQGDIIVSPGANTGFVRIDKQYPYHFVYDNGDRHFMFGTTYYNMVLNACAGDRWKVAIDSALVFGINKFRVFVNSLKDERTPDPLVHPYQSKGDSIIFEHLNPEYFEALDRIVQYAYVKGMNVDLIVLGNGRDKYSHAGQDIETRYAQYLINRYAAYPNVMWVLVNEWNYVFREHDKGKPYWNALGEYMWKNDPYHYRGSLRRPLSVHQQTRVDFQFFNYDWPTHAIVQLGVRNGQGTVKDEWDDSDPTFKTATKHGDEWGNYSITYNLGHDMPVVNDEYGYIGEPRDKSEATNNDKSTWPRFTREKHRNVMWGIYLAGGYGSAGDKNQYSDGKPYFSANWHSEPEEYSDIKVLTDFFTSGDIEYWKMKSNNDLITSGERVYALAEAGRQYLFYSAEGNSFSAILEPGNYRQVLVNPISGRQKELDNVIGGETGFSLDGSQDWLVWLRKVDG